MVRAAGRPAKSDAFRPRVGRAKAGVAFFLLTPGRLECTPFECGRRADLRSLERR